MPSWSHDASFDYDRPLLEELRLVENNKSQDKVRYLFVLFCSSCGSLRRWLHLVRRTGRCKLARIKRWWWSFDVVYKVTSEAEVRGLELTVGTRYQGRGIDTDFEDSRACLLSHCGPALSQGYSTLSFLDNHVPHHYCHHYGCS